LEFDNNAFEQLHDAFKAQAGTSFSSFDKPGDAISDELTYKRKITAKIQALLLEDMTPAALGERVLSIQNKHPFAPIRWQTIDEVSKNTALADRYYAAIGNLSNTSIPPSQRVQQAVTTLTNMRQEFGKDIDALRSGERWGVVLSVLSLFEPDKSAFCKVTVWSKVSEVLGFGPLFSSGDKFDTGMYPRFFQLLKTIFKKLEAQGYDPRDMHDVQSFVWIAERWGGETSANGLTRDSVLAAIADYDELGADGFYQKYGFASAKKYFVKYEGMLYPSKGIYGVAFKYTEAEKPQKSTDFSGGIEVVTDTLKALGFEIVVSEEDYDIGTSSAEKRSHALNQILYGPPGTGKTYQTARLAVEICDGFTSSLDRTKLMERYQELRNVGRIHFTTFHQSTAYEEFVEGLRPQTDTDSGSTAFRLEAQDGLFRKVCKAAQQAKTVSKTQTIDLADRTFYKMSLGRSGSEDNVFDASVETGTISLGYGGDVDWSDPMYTKYQNVADRWREIRPDAHGNSGDIVQTFTFRGMSIGDIVIVSDGNLKFRAIGEITGDYQYVGDAGKDEAGVFGGQDLYQHQRDVRWLKVLDNSLDASDIYSKRFSQASCYRFNKPDLNINAINELVSGQEPEEAPDQQVKPYVLIVDEINRADMAKVFGELITLLEEDKRRGADNEISLTLPYSQEKFSVPANLYLIGTMNTADRSIALLDTALRRRFAFTEVSPEPSLLEIVGDLDLSKLLSLINSRIEALRGREHCIGHSYFMGLESRAAVNDVMRYKIIPLLEEYFFDDWETIAKVLGPADPQSENGFLDKQTVYPFGQTGQAYERWSVKSGAFDYSGLLSA